MPLKKDAVSVVLQTWDAVLMTEHNTQKSRGKLWRALELDVTTPNSVTFSFLTLPWNQTLEGRKKKTQNFNNAKKEKKCEIDWKLYAKFRGSLKICFNTLVSH